MNKKIYQRLEKRFNKLEDQIAEINSKIIELDYNYRGNNSFDNTFNKVKQQKYSFSKVPTGFDTRDFYEGRSRNWADETFNPAGFQE